MKHFLIKYFAFIFMLLFIGLNFNINKQWNL